MMISLGSDTNKGLRRPSCRNLLLGATHRYLCRLKIQVITATFLLEPGGEPEPNYEALKIQGDCEE